MSNNRYISPTLRDVLILVFFFFLILAAETQTHFLGFVLDFVYHYTQWQITKFSFVLFFIAAAAAYFSYRRWKDLQIEIEKIRTVETSLLESELQSKALLSSIPNIIIRIRRDGTFLAVNTSAESPSEIFSDNIIGLTIADLFPPEIAKRKMHAVTRALQTNEVQVVAFEYLGSRYEARFVAGGINEVIALIRDIREAEEISEALAQSELRFLEVVESLSEGLVITDIDDNILYMNHRMEELCGWQLKDVKGKPGYSFYLPKERWESLQQRNKERAAGISSRYEEQMLRKDGSLFWAEVYGAPFRDLKGTIKGTIGTVTDITEQKWNEKLQSALYQITELTSIEMEMKEFFERLHHIIGGLIYAKNFYIALYDPASEIISFPYFVDEVDPPAEPRKFSNGSTEYILKTGNIFHSPRTLAKNMEAQGAISIIGAEAVDWLGVPLKSAEKTFGALVIQSYDPEITFGEKEKGVLVFVSRHIAAAILQKSEKERFRAIWEHSADGMRVTNKNGTIIMVNDAYCTMFKKARAELVGQLYSVVYNNTESEISAGVEIYKQRFSNNIITTGTEADIVLWNKKEITVEFSTSFITFGVNERMLLTVFRDVTERERLEEQLQHAQKMDSIGVLAGGIAHDFNNVLAMILGAAEIIKNRAKENPDILKFSNIICSAAERGSGIAKQLLMFARSEKGILKPLSLSQFVSDVCRLLEHSIPKSISLQTNFTAENDILLGDGDQLNQVLINLAVNARDAIEQKGIPGILQFNISNISGLSIAKEFPEVIDQQYVRLQVVDNGSGIEEHIVERMFEPFFSTKERGKGTGLGLSIVHGIVKNHRGFISVQSTVGAGTTFTLYFPATYLPLKETSKKETISPAVLSPAKNGYILIVDDEVSLAETLQDELQSEGYQTLLAHTGEEALEQVVKYSGQISLIISDIGMPGMSGTDLIKKIRSMNIATNVILMTGYLDHKTKDELLNIGAAEVLTKPFELKDITHAVSKILSLSQNQM